MTLEELYKLRDELLNHVVGTNYNMQKVLEINKEIECKKKELKLVKELNLKESGE